MCSPEDERAGHASLISVVDFSLVPAILQLAEAEVECQIYLLNIHQTADAWAGSKEEKLTRLTVTSVCIRIGKIISHYLVIKFSNYPSNTTGMSPLRETSYSWLHQLLAAFYTFAVGGVKFSLLFSVKTHKLWVNATSFNNIIDSGLLSIAMPMVPNRCR